MSGLLVRSTLIMRENLEEMNRRNRTATPILLGGAALTRNYVERDLRARVRRAGCSTARTPSKDCARSIELMTEKASGEIDPSFGTTPSGRSLPPRKRALIGHRRPGDAAAPFARGHGGQSRLPAAFPRHTNRQGDPARRRARLPQRDGALPQPVGLPPESRRERRGVQVPRPRRAAQSARRGQGGGRARPPGRLGLLRRRGRRRRPRRVQRRDRFGRARRGSISPASASTPTCASPTSSAPPTASTSTTPRSSSSPSATPRLEEGARTVRGPTATSTT